MGENRDAALRFDGAVAVVTGSTSDPSIGRSCATRLAREGAAVVVNGRSPDAVDDTVAQLTSEGLRATGVAGSMEDEGTALRLLDAAIGTFGRVDLVVNTVGGAPHTGGAMTLERDAYLATLAVNTWPSIAIVQEAMKAGLADDGGGSVVFISSNTVNMTTPAMIAYKSGKAALNALTTTLARDLGPRVRVNGVAPGLTITSATRPFWEGDGGAAAGSQLVLGRLPHADDIANVAVFLLSPDAAMVTGQIIDVDAGTSLIVGWSPFAPQPATGGE